MDLSLCEFCEFVFFVRGDRLEGEGIGDDVRVDEDVVIGTGWLPGTFPLLRGLLLGPLRGAYLEKGAYLPAVFPTCEDIDSYSWEEEADRDEDEELSGLTGDFPDSGFVQVPSLLVWEALL